MILFKRIFLLLLLWILIIFGCVIFLCTTDIGMGLIAKIVVHHMPGLSFGTISGNIANFNIVSLNYQTDMGIIRIKKCSILLNIKDLFLKKKINIDYCCLQDIFFSIKQLNTVHKNIKEKRIGENNSNFSFMNFFAFKKVVLNNIHIILDSYVINLKQLDTGVIITSGLLRVLPTQISGLTINFLLENKDLLNKKKYFLNSIHYDEYKKLLHFKNVITEILNKLLIFISKINIPFNIILDEVIGQDLYIVNNYHITNCIVKMSWIHDQSANIHLDVKLPFGNFNVEGNIALDNNRLVNITMNYVTYSAMLSDNNKISDNSDIKKIAILITGEIFNEICIHCDIVGIISEVNILLKIKLTQLDIPITLSIIGQNLSFSFFGTNYRAKVVNFFLDGKIYDYYVNMDLELVHSKISVMSVVMCVIGNVNNYIFSVLKAKIVDKTGGFCAIQGIIDWNKEIRWSSELLLHKFNIFYQNNWLNKHPIVSSGYISAKGNIFANNTWDIAISRVDIIGQVQNDRVACNGLIYKNVLGEWSIPFFLIEWGSNVLHIKGEIKENYVIDAVLQAPELNFLNSKLDGNVYGIIKLRGLVQSPVLYLALTAHSLFWKNNKNLFFDTAILHSRIYCNGVNNSDVFLQVNTVQYGAMSLHKLIVEMRGNVKQHVLKLIMHYNSTSFGEIQISGLLDVNRKLWSGKIGKTSIVTPIGIWKLLQDIVLVYQYATHRVFISSHDWECVDCYVSVKNCIRNDVLQNKIRAILKNFNITQCQMFLPECIDTHMAYIHCADLYWVVGRNSLPQGSVMLSMVQMKIKFDNKEKDTLILINDIAIQWSCIQNTVYCKWCIDNEKINGFFKINVLYDKSSIITGSINVRNFILQPFINSFFYLKDIAVNGVLNVNIFFCGCIYCPEIYGVIECKNFDFYNPSSFFFIKNSFILMNFLGDRIKLDGTMHINDKNKIYLHGDVFEWNSANRMQLILQIKGDQVYCNISSNIRAKISPNITCMINMKEIDIYGKVGVPWADIVIQNLPKNVANSISPEEVLIEGNDAKCVINDNSNKKDSTIFAVSANIDIHLGTEVNINGWGLHTKLQGNVGVEYNNKSSLVLKGNVDIPSGYVKAYGQHLIIKKGQLLFSGTINQSYFDIEMVANDSNVKNEVISGVKLTGTFNQPTLKVLFDSSLFSRQEAISDIFRNHNLIISNADSNIITSLLIGLGAEHNEKFINKVGRILGLENVTLDSQRIGSTSLVSLGGYISPNVQIRYGVSVLDLLATVTVKYRLNPQLYLEATSGPNPAIGIFYRLDL